MNQLEVSPTHIVASEYRSAAIGTIFMTGFGAVWLFLGLAEFGRAPYWLYGVLAVACAAMIWASVVRLRTPAPPINEETRIITKRIRRQFVLINVVQWTVIGVGIAFLSQYHHQDLIVPFIAVVVALHFLPLARLFRQQIYYHGCILLLAWVQVCYWGPLSREVLPSAVAIGTGGILWLIGATRLVVTRFERKNDESRIP